MDAITIFVICITWRKGIRRLWGLPYNTHCDILPVLCDALPVFDVLCKRVLSFFADVH